jgi:hypothetical protein
MPTIELDKSAKEVNVTEVSQGLEKTAEAESSLKTSQENAGNKPDEPVVKEEKEKTVEGDKPKTEEGEKESSIELDIEELERDEKGNLVFNTGTKEGTKYLGKDLKELLANIKGGLTAKDNTITKFKAQGLKVPDDFTGERRESQAIDIKLPSREEILSEILPQYTRSGEFKPEMLSWAKTQWREYEVENGAVATIELKQQIQQLQVETESRYAQANVEALNKLSIHDETDQIRDMLADWEVDVEDFDYTAVLDRVHADPKNFKDNGIRKTAVVVKEAMREIKKIVSERNKGEITKTEKDTKKKVEEKVANDRIKKTGLPSTPQGGREFQKPSARPPAKTFDEALENALADMNKR